MSVRGVIAAFAVLGIVEAGLIVPKVSRAGQLAETATATTINGSMQSLNNTNIHAPNKARALARQVQEHRGVPAQANDGQNPGARSAKVAQGRAAASQPTAFNEKSAVRGRTYTTDGTVVFDGAVNKGRIVIVVRIDGPNKFQLLGFRPLDPEMPQFPDKAQVQVSGTYVGRIKEPQTGSLIHGFDKAEFFAGGTVQAAPQQEQPKPEEKPTFSAVLKGWTFRGTAQVDGRATGVFVNENRVRYAQAGDELSDGIRVKKVFNGSVRVSIENKNLDLMPW